MIDKKFEFVYDIIEQTSDDNIGYNTDNNELYEIMNEVKDNLYHIYDKTENNYYKIGRLIH